MDPFNEAFSKLDFEGMARAWHEGDIKWHAAEWAQFIARVEQLQLERQITAIEKAAKEKAVILGGLGFNGVPILIEVHEILDIIKIKLN